MSLPFLSDLESNIKFCDDAIGHMIDAHAATEDGEHDKELLSALVEVRNLKICLTDWIDEAKKAGYAR